MYHLLTGVSDKDDAFGETELREQAWNLLVTSGAIFNPQFSFSEPNRKITFRATELAKEWKSAVASVQNTPVAGPLEQLRELLERMLNPEPTQRPQLDELEAKGKEILEALKEAGHSTSLDNIPRVVDSPKAAARRAALLKSVQLFAGLKR
jgi:hypothetical protein